MTATASTSRVQRPDVPKPNQYQRQQPKAARALTYRASDKDKDHWATSISRNAPIHAKPTGRSPQVQQRTSTTDTLCAPCSLYSRSTMTMNENAPPGASSGRRIQLEDLPALQDRQSGHQMANHQAGGGDRDRTGDLKLAKLALSQLSYAPRSSRTGPSAVRGAAIT